MFPGLDISHVLVRDTSAEMSDFMQVDLEGFRQPWTRLYVMLCIQLTVEGPLLCRGSRKVAASCSADDFVAERNDGDQGSVLSAYSCS